MQHPTFPFRASSAFLPTAEPSIKSKEKAPAHDAKGASSVLAHLAEYAKEKDDKPLAVGIVGLTNVSRIIFAA
jgi:hypothetical protein